MNSSEWIGSPISYGGLQLKNRILFAPTTMGLKEDEYFAKLEAIAAGGCAMLIIGDVPVSKTRFGYSLFSKKGFAHYQKLAALAHRHHCRLCAQLHQNDTHFAGLIKYVPQVLTGKISQMELRTLANQETGAYITGLSTDQVAAITTSFGPAALRAMEAGFDMVQVHGDRMCGSFSSALFNQRQDQYGGSPENRTRFAVEAVTAIRKAAPSLPIDYKLAIRTEQPHYGNAGILEEELPLFVPALEQAGVTSFHVALANHGKLEDTIPPASHPDFGAPGCFLPFCDTVRTLTDLPLCGVGGLNDPAFVAEQLANGRIDCAAMSRQLVADPDWVNKVLDGKEDTIHRCVRCNRECLGGMMQHKGVHCIYDKAR